MVMVGQVIHEPLNQWFMGNLTTIPVEFGFLWDFELLKLRICSLYHENQRSVHPTAPVLLIKNGPLQFVGRRFYRSIDLRF